MELARDDIFWRAVRNTIMWACTSPLVEVSVALVLALCSLRPRVRRQVLPCRLVHARPHVVHRGRHLVAVDLQLTIGGP